ncbi:hypothetical protein BKA93DRAFT_750421 [Sparassis latifolia]
MLSYDLASYRFVCLTEHIDLRPVGSAAKVELGLVWQRQWLNPVGTRCIVFRQGMDDSNVTEVKTPSPRNSSSHFMSGTGIGKLGVIWFYLLVTPYEPPRSLALSGWTSLVSSAFRIPDYEVEVFGLRDSAAKKLGLVMIQTGLSHHMQTRPTPIGTLHPSTNVALSAVERYNMMALRSILHAGDAIAGGLEFLR